MMIRFQRKTNPLSNINNDKKDESQKTDWIVENEKENYSFIQR